MLTLNFTLIFNFYYLLLLFSSCQQWQGLRGPGAHYCLGPCIEEGGETSKVRTVEKFEIKNLDFRVDFAFVFAARGFQNSL